MIWDHIRKLREEQNLTIFLTTHYMEETAEADRVVILDKGHEEYHILKDKTIHFDDKEVARAAVAAKFA